MAWGRLHHSLEVFIMKLAVVIRIDSHATDGYSFFVEKPYDDGSFWFDDEPHYKVVQWLDVPIGEHAEWLVHQGCNYIDSKRKKLDADTTRAKTHLAEMQSKFLSLTHQPVE